MDIGMVNEEEVQCPLCLRYHNIKKRCLGSDDEEEKPKPSLCEVFGGTAKVIGVAGVAAMVLSRANEMRLCDKLPQTESTPCMLTSVFRINGDGVSIHLGKAVMGAMVLTGVIGAVWSWACKQRLRRQREEEFRANLEICKECWGGIRQALLNENDSKLSDGAM